MFPFQFTRPRGARHTVSTVGMAREVSIHAPTRGATPEDEGGADGRVVSIHAPTGGATHRRQNVRRENGFQFTRPRGARQRHGVTLSAASGFNSRAHGGRDVVEDGLLAAEEVSIHAPTGGATDCPRAANRGVGVSIHAPTGGATVPHSRISSSKSFNSRAHGGRDSNPRTASRKKNVSIHAPTGGATRRGASRRARHPVSIHAPTGGATRGVAYALGV